MKETIMTVYWINERKSWFFKNINRINKHLAKVSKRKRRHKLEKLKMKTLNH
jgi:hypothetical protein